MHIRQATPEDAQAIAGIHVNAWRAAYADILPASYLASLSLVERTAMWVQIMAEGKSHLLVALRDREIQGWINFGASRDADARPIDAEVWALYVAPDAWSSGVGQALWLATRSRLQSLGFTACNLWVLRHNLRAIKFYGQAGFIEDDTPPKYFSIEGQQFEEVRYQCPLLSKIPP